MALGLGASLGKTGLTTPGVVTDNLVMKHMYPAGAVQPVSDGAVDINADAANNEHIDVGAISLTTNDVSLSAWVYVTDFVENAGIICNRESTGTEKGIILRTDSSGPKFQALLDYGGGSFEVSSDNANTNEWYHVCVTWDRSDNASMYVNGVLHNTTDISAQSSVNITHSTVAKIGQHQGTVEFRGYICNAGYWDRVLTQTEIKSIMWKQYADLTSSETASLISWWNLDTLTEFDSAGTDDGLIFDENDTTVGSELLTGFTNGTSYPFDTFTSSGRDISAAIETSGDWGGCVSNAINVTAGEWYKCTFDLTYNSGTDDIRMAIANNPSGASTQRSNDTYTSTNGTNTMYFRVATTDSVAYFQIGTGESADVINFSMSNISLKKMNGNHGEMK